MFRARLQLATSNGKKVRSANRLSRSALRRRMHRKQMVGTKAHALFPGASDDRGPVVLRYPAALFPLLDHRSGPIDIDGHRGKRVPGVKEVVKRSHVAEYASDELSVQGPRMIPMTSRLPVRTISPMGRASTPARFRSEMAKRLVSARVMARFETKREAAEALGITLDRYEKWESGRTPVPAQYVGPVCALFHIDANYLFGIEATPAASRKTG